MIDLEKLYYANICDMLQKSFEAIKAPGSCVYHGGKPDYEGALMLVYNIQKKLEKLISLREERMDENKKTLTLKKLEVKALRLTEILLGHVDNYPLGMVNVVPISVYPCIKNIFMSEILSQLQELTDD